MIKAKMRYTAVAVLPILTLFYPPFFLLSNASCSHDRASTRILSTRASVLCKISSIRFYWNYEILIKYKVSLVFMKFDNVFRKWLLYRNYQNWRFIISCILCIASIDQVHLVTLKYETRSLWHACLDFETVNGCPAALLYFR